MKVVVGMDPSFRNWGMAKCFMDDAGQLTVQDTEVIRAKVPKQKRKNLEDVAVSEELITRAFKFAKGADLVCMELPVGTQSAQGMKAYGVCIAVAACLKCAGIPILVTTPREVKLVVGDAEASKAEVIEWVNTKHPETPWPRRKFKGEFLINAAEAEHIADAVVAIYASKKTPQFNQSFN